MGSCGSRGGGAGGGGNQLYSPSMMIGSESSARSLKQLQSDASSFGLTIKKEEYSGRYAFYNDGKMIARTTGTTFTEAKSYFNDPYAKHRVPAGKLRPGAMVPDAELRGTASNRGENTAYSKRGEFARFRGL